MQPIMGRKYQSRKGRAKTFALQKVANGFGQCGFGPALGQRPCQPVEAQDLGQHVHESRAQQVASLGEDRVQARTAPLQLVFRHLHREGHVRRRSSDPQITEELDQVRVGAFIEDQEAGVTPWVTPSSVTSTVCVWPPK
jgi:hypothetical protein